MKNLILSICFAAIFFVQTIFACSLAVKPIGKFHEAEFVFIGEVVGYTQPVKSAKLSKEAYGLIVKIKESVFLPKTPKTHFEIFPIELWADCSESGTDVQTLKKNFPVNSEIRVIAKEAETLPKDLTDGNIRLEYRPNELGNIALNYFENKRMTSADSFFDYASYKYDENKDPITKYLLPNFEIRKDLLRLSQATNRGEVTTILDKLLFTPVFSDLSFSELFKNYTLTEAEYLAYFETHLRMTDPEIYNQYKAYNGALLVLIQSGEKRDAAEKALGEALREGTEIERDKLIYRSLQILRKNKPK